MRKAVLPILLLTALSLGGCAHRKALDEFAVVRNAPLVIPPDYSLTPPVAGGVIPSATETQGQAIQALFGGPAPRSATESMLLDAAGRDRVALGVRSTAGDPGTNIVDKGSVTSAIIAAPVGDGRDATASTPN